MVSGIRFGGLASGMDTEGMVKQLMQSERIRVDKFTQQKILKQWQQTEYNSMNKLMANFILDSRKKLELTKTTSSGALVSGGIDSVTWAKSAVSSNSSAFDVTASASAPSGVSTIEVLQLAKGASMSSTANVSSTLTAESMGLTFDALNEAKIKINDKEITLLKDDNIAAITKKIREAVPDLNVNFDAGSSRLFISTKSTNSQSIIKFGSDENTYKLMSAFNLSKPTTLTSAGAIDNTKTAAELFGFSGSTVININDKSITIDETDTIDTIASKITTAGVSASYDSGTGIFTLSSPAGLNVSQDANTMQFFNGIGFADSTMSQGQDAKIKYNGTDELSYSSNNISINGLNLTLKAKTTGEETIRTDTNVDGAYNKIKEFIDEYNKLIDVFNAKLGEKTYRDFPPLTDEQKKEMSESDIKLWEEKAKSGLIRNDSTINNMLTKMRQDIYESVTGAGSIYEFGITTGNWRDNGKLQIDETKLKDALRNDSEKVLNTLFKTSSIPEETIYESDSEEDKTAKKSRMAQRQAESGAFIRIYDNMTTGIKDIVSKSGPGSESTLLRSIKSNILVDYVTKGSKSLLDSDIGDIDKRIDRENQRLITIEQRYWKQFTAMEQAMSQMNSQSSWLSQQFGGQ